MNKNLKDSGEMMKYFIKNLDPDIKSSWIRCLNEHHLSPTSIGKPDFVTKSELRNQMEPIQELLGIASPKIKSLLSKIKNHNYGLCVASREGVKLNCRGDTALLDRIEITGSTSGAVWSEDRQGTNGIGTAIYLERPVSIIRNEHFSQNYHDWTCTAVPVFGPDNALQCIINATTDRPTTPEEQALLRSILISAARRIENTYFSHKYRHHRILKLSLDSNFIDSACEVRLALSDTDRVVDATSPLETTLKIDRDHFITRPVTDVLALNLDAMQANQSTFVSALNPANTDVHALLCEDKPAAHRPYDPAGSRRPGKTMSEGFGKSVFARHPQLALDYERAKRLIRAGLPLVLRGEEGSGRIDFARLLGEEVYGAALTTLRGGADTVEMASFLLHPANLRGAYYIENADKASPSFMQGLAQLASTQIKSAETPKFSIMLGCSGQTGADSVISKCLTFSTEKIVFPAVRNYPNVSAVVEHLLNEQKDLSNQREKNFCPRALQLLTSYFWEGNLEQVRFVIRYALTVSQGTTMGLSDLPKYLRGTTAAISDDASPEATERGTLVAALNLNNWNVSRTASYLGLSRATLNRRIRNSGIQRPNK